MNGSSRADMFCAATRHQRVDGVDCAPCCCEYAGVYMGCMMNSWCQVLPWG